MSFAFAPQSQKQSEKAAPAFIQRKAKLGAVNDVQSNPGSFGVGGGVFGSWGGLYQPRLGGDPTSTARSEGYGEAGANFGIHSGMVLGGTNFRLGVEGAAGRELNGGPDELRWYRLGFTFGLSR